MIVLIGFMGAGKTTVGRLLARRIGLPFVDTDELVEAHAGAPITEIFERGGEPAFRSLERAVVAEVLAGPSVVVALGGGALFDPATRTQLDWIDHRIHLAVSFTDAMHRIGAQEGTRPLLATEDPRAMHADRRPIYERVATLEVDTTERSPREIVDEILEQTGLGAGAEKGVERVAVALPGREYEVTVGSGLASRIAELVPLDRAERAFIVTQQARDTSALESSLRSAGCEVVRLEVGEGETSKSLDMAARLFDELATRAAHRSDLIVSYGGGVVSDVAGFVASTLNRGMPLVHVPTTVLGQVDAAIGGKTSINLDHGKNLVGTIYQPVAVLCDVDLLATLPVEEVRSGLAEAIKHGLIADPQLLDVITLNANGLLARDPEPLKEIVAWSAAIKASFVTADEHDRAQRAVLNYGHTFAHAIERAAGYSGVRHGHAVGLGMMAAAHLARELGRLDEEAVEVHRTTLSSVGLPVSAHLDVDVLEQGWIHDKKYQGGVRFVLLAAIGKAEAGIQAPRDAIERALRRMSP